jgi:transcriptional regulator with XRE-family HTH domain
MGDNLDRLLGLHSMSATRASSVLGISAQALSEIRKGKRASPNIDTLEKISDFFEVSVDRLRKATVAELLQDEIADPDRFARVEKKLGR